MKQIIIILILAVTFVFVGCKKSDDPTSPTHNDCLTQLESASKCKATLPDCGGERLKTSVRCLGTNADGKTRCSRSTLSPCGFCNTHDGQWNGTCPIETKNACGYCDEHTEQYKP